MLCCHTTLMFLTCLLCYVDVSNTGIFVVHNLVILSEATLPIYVIIHFPLLAYREQTAQIDMYNLRKIIEQCHCITVTPHGVMMTQITSKYIVFLKAFSGYWNENIKLLHSLAYVKGISRWPVDFLYSRSLTSKAFLCRDVIMEDPLSGVPNTSCFLF